MRALLLALLCASPALAAETTVTPPPEIAAPLPPPPPGGLIVSGDRLAISASVCGMLGMIEPGVPGPDYVPGIDARGNAVAPADLPTPQPGIADYPIEIGLEIRHRFGVTAASPLFRTEAIAGLVTVHNGHAWFNGIPLANNERDMMLAACQEMRGHRE
jgi:hypothetical protein